MSGKPKHGLSYTPEYRAWQTMRLRCTEPTNAAYPNYGGRGITVCDRWLNSVEHFVSDMGPKPTPKHELDRIDNNAGYSPENCRWVERKINDRNRRSNRLIKHDGAQVSLAELAERHGIRPDTLAYRIDSGWTLDVALNTPTRAKAPNGMPKPLKRPCTECGSPTKGVRCRPCENRARPARRKEAA